MAEARSPSPVGGSCSAARKMQMDARALRMLGTDLFPGESGRRALDACCLDGGLDLAANDTSHSGAGRIEGDAIRCPYDPWRFGLDGGCDHGSYFNCPMPAAARVRAFVVEERFGRLFACDDPDEGQAECALSHLPGWDDRSRVRCTYDDLGTLSVISQEIIVNQVDAHYFGPVHGPRLAYFTSQFDDGSGRQISSGGHQTMTGGDGQLVVKAFYTGPGIRIGRFAGETDVVQVVLHILVEDGTIQLSQNIITNARYIPDVAQDFALNAQYQALELAAFSQDLQIWRTEAPGLRIVRLLSNAHF